MFLQRRDHLIQFTIGSVYHRLNPFLSLALALQRFL